jgi:hypothetical protein
MMLASQLSENLETQISAFVWKKMIIHEIYSENRLENWDDSHLIPMNCPTLECT